MEENNPRKRPRPVVSCMRCRDRKLKCDRNTPCENCVKAQNGAACTYFNSAGSTSKENNSVPMVPVASIIDLQSRLAKVEELLGIQPDKPSLAERSLSQPIGTVVVKGNSSAYRGQNDRATLLNQFLEVKDHINELSKDAQVQATAKQIKFLQDKSRSKIASPDSHVESDLCLSLLKLREFLPPREYCDRLVSIYCQHFERTMRVLHIPAFMKEYDLLWANTNWDMLVSSSVIPKLTAMMTMAYHMDDTKQSNDDMIHRSYLKGTALDLIQSWVDELTRKQRTEISTLQVEILLLLSRSLRHLHPEKLWSSTGALVRSAMTMGLHVNPNNIPTLTPFSAEMRRRLWSCVLEIDLQASMVCGMPLIVPEVDSSSLTSANLDDVEFGESSSTLPTSRPIEVYTDNIYQVLLASSLPQRIKALLLIQRGTPDIYEGMRLGGELQKFLALKPQVMNLHYNSGTPDGGFLLHRVLLDLYMRRPILCLYKPFLVNHQQVPSIPAEIQKHCLESSRVILSYQDFYTINALSTITNSPWAHQNFFYRCCKTDILWAALTLCEQIKQDCETSPSDSGPLVKTVENTIMCLINRVAQKGGDLKDIVFLAVVLKSVQLSNSAAERPQLLHETARRTMVACREQLLQPLVSHETSSSTYTKGKSSSTSSTPMASRNTINVPITHPELDSTSLGDKSHHLESFGDTGQWFVDLPDLAAEYVNFQPAMFDNNDPLNFGITRGWEWDHMWQ